MSRARPFRLAFDQGPPPSAGHERRNEATCGDDGDDVRSRSNSEDASEVRPSLQRAWMRVAVRSWPNVLLGKRFAWLSSRPIAREASPARSADCASRSKATSSASESPLAEGRGAAACAGGDDAAGSSGATDASALGAGWGGAGSPPETSAVETVDDGAAGEAARPAIAM